MSVTMPAGEHRRRGAGLPPFQALLDDHADVVLRFLIARVGHVDAEDCFQETFLAALRAYPRLRDSANLRGWLLTIARNKVTDAHRDAQRRPILSEELDTATAAPHEPADGELWDAVGRLPAKQRNAVALRFAEDRSYDDIARTMATTPEAARRNVHEGIKKLRRGQR
jgi:RNA polymerase sigma factor (sigma-70 family)